MRLEHPYISLFNTDVSKLKSILSELDDELWGRDTFRQKMFKVHKQTQSIVFKWSSSSNEKTDKSFVNTEISKTKLGKEIDLQIEKIKSYYPNKSIQGSMLVLLPPGGMIREHSDKGKLKLINRVHLPVVTNSQCIFNIDKVDYFFEEGQCFEFDNTRTHYVNNTGDTPRIHLIIDFK